MKEIAQIRRLSLWIFLIPLIAINTCLLIAVNSSILEGSIFTVDMIGKSNFTIPYIDGSLSISRASRTFPQYLIFKPAMFFTAFFLYLYWKKNNFLINKFNNISNKKYKFKTFGILSAIFLIIHSVFLGVDIDVKVFKLFRRVVLLGFIIFEIIAQSILVYHLFILKNKIKNLLNHKVLIMKIVLVSVLAIVALLSIPMLVTKGNIHFKHALEWNYFVGVVSFYFLTHLFWKKNL